MLPRVLEYGKILIEDKVKPGDIVIDATCGNGNDTLFLSKLVGEKGNVFAFDIQEEAINNTKHKLDIEKLNNVTLYQTGHENIITTIPTKYFGNISGAMFNLGYLPGGDKTITTTGKTTIKAICDLLNIMKVNGIIVLIIYHGHEEGKKEKHELLSYLQTIDQKYAQVLQYSFINQRNNAPFLIAIEKIK